MADGFNHGVRRCGRSSATLFRTSEHAGEDRPVGTNGRVEIANVRNTK